MKEKLCHPFPKAFGAISEATSRSGFTMASDVQTCSLLRTLAAAKPAGKFLELGTGTGLSTSWILDGMDDESSLISIDNDPGSIEIANRYLGNDKRLQVMLTDAGKWIEENKYQQFDYIFADTWHGKYLLLDQVLDMLSKGGLYIVDDMLPQPNWPVGHQEKAFRFVTELELKEALMLTRLDWATGIIIGVKK